MSRIGPEEGLIGPEVNYFGYYTDLMYLDMYLWSTRGTAQTCHEIKKKYESSFSPIIGPVSALANNSNLGNNNRVVLSCIIVFLLHLVEKGIGAFR